MAGRGSSHQGEDKVTSSSQEVLPHTFQLATHVTEEKPSTATPGSQTQKPHLGHRWEAGTCCKDVQPGACTLVPLPNLLPWDSGSPLFLAFWGFLHPPGQERGSWPRWRHC